MIIALEHERLRRHTLREDESRRAFIRRDYERALDAACEAVRLAPSCDQALILLGDVFSALNRDVEALRAYHRARRLAPHSAEALWSIASIHSLAGRWRDAHRYLARARILLQRGDGLLYEWISEDLAIALARLGRTDDALEAARWGLKRRPAGRRLRLLREQLKHAQRSPLRVVPS